MWIEKRKYFCMSCNEWIIEDDMVSYSCRTKKGFCRDCSKKLDFKAMQRIKKDGFDFGEQLSLL